ncbi:MAG: hypothetical protein A3A80_03775 [Candidatus Terrybacteria bacterium RIFCSPLOWO2_01_FULL_44_24]|uniref:Thioesterase domain-containing protein n=1 Tax=Candidatus Terrybacteria bacterium RIFCSPHIGHO2_01_FULL_43_35 TaxID=1802361 RepID=A0A1G2PHM5_9BACT|nr:MAG: hypothetical protein A2828_00105 [Candidatus Terrybacteria bacterium RIFCSPHIGHO2_01_FULL_43_35]OHA49311.1 MAG: hypothetical protein A3B75_02480 [Candidatus Terrybacteria bacterium RIFCSPHIGHO2_02_FULL_43_14]OHA52009.1 MAG: hypothetical protein A3A80_03775 [Candidatus Terrybacteria bacterium RIFCSPLOWO2_01_FULL_44_24]
MGRLDELAVRASQEPLAEFLGIKFDFFSEGAVNASLPIRQDFLIPEGFVQGGVITTLADFAGVYAAMTKIKQGHAPAVSIDITFFRPFTLDDKTMHAVAVVQNESRSFVWVTVNVFVEKGKKKAQMTAIFAKPRQDNITAS